MGSSSPLLQLLSFSACTALLFCLTTSHSSPGKTNIVDPAVSGEHGSKKLSASTSNAGVRYIPVTKVKLSLYYEALCPYCRNFIAHPLANAVDSGLMDIVNLELVPWGNAHVDRNSNTIICQHGVDECYLNTIHACAINLWPDVKKHFSFIHCVESRWDGKTGSRPEWESCARQLGLPTHDIQQCYTTGLGKKLELEHGQRTENLKPPREFVPWVVVNGKPLLQEYGDFVKYVCRASKGMTKPKACSSPPSLNTTSKEEKPTNLVCHKLEPSSNKASSLEHHSKVEARV